MGGGPLGIFLMATSTTGSFTNDKKNSYERIIQAVELRSDGGCRLCIGNLQTRGNGHVFENVWFDTHQHTQQDSVSNSKESSNFISGILDLHQMVGSIGSAVITLYDLHHDVKAIHNERKGLPFDPKRRILTFIREAPLTLSVDNPTVIWEGAFVSTPAEDVLPQTTRAAKPRKQSVSQSRRPDSDNAREMPTRNIRSIVFRQDTEAGQPTEMMSFDELDRPQKNSSASGKISNLLKAAYDISMEQIQDVRNNSSGYMLVIAEAMPVGIGTGVSVAHQGYDTYTGDQTVGGAVGVLGTDAVVGFVGGKLCILGYKVIKRVGKIGGKLIQRVNERGIGKLENIRPNKRIEALDLTQSKVPLGQKSSSGEILDYSHKYRKAGENFLDGSAKEFNGELRKTIKVVSYHNNGDPAQGKSSLMWWTTIGEGNKLHTIEQVKDRLALLSDWGARSHVLVAEIPAGTNIKFLYGRAKSYACEINIGEIRPGGGVQIAIEKFNPIWIKEIAKMPK
jgi:hypothetical protein